MRDLGPATLARYLLGRRCAILAAATSPVLLPVSFLLVLSAAVARLYDREILLHDPWLLLEPAGLSILVATAVFIAARPWEARPRWREWATFLGLFWLTAPLAWLYAIPYERFLAPVEAYRANMWTLGAVSLCRVLLFARVLAVVYGAHFRPALWRILAAGAAIVVALSFVLPMPVIDIMGGSTPTRMESEVEATVWLTVLSAGAALPLLLVAVAVTRHRGRWSVPRGSTSSRPSAAFLVPAAALAAGAAGLAWAQPAQLRRARVEELLRSGAIGEAIATMDELGQGAFPASWDPPPEDTRDPPGMDALVEALLQAPASAWIGELYAEKIVAHSTAYDRALYGTERYRETPLPPPSPEERKLLEFLLAHDRWLRELCVEEIRERLEPPPEAQLPSSSSRRRARP